MTTCEIRNATDLEVAAFYGQDTHHKVMLVDGVPVAMGATSRVNGRLWIMLKVKGAIGAKAGRQLFWATMKMLREIGAAEPVFAVCQFESAERFLATLGFFPTQETIDGYRVWTWISAHSR